MTRIEPGGDGPAELARWCAAVALVLRDLAPRVRRLSEQVGLDWSDERGRDWAERAARVHRELGRDAEVADALGRVVGPGLVGPLVSGPSASAARGPGVRLGGTEGERAGDDRGIAIAQLPEPGPPSG